MNSWLLLPFQVRALFVAALLTVDPIVIVSWFRCAVFELRLCFGEAPLDKQLHRPIDGNLHNTALAGLHFLVPFFLLLSPATKRSPWRLAGVALLLLVMRLVDLYWLIMPTFTDEATLNWINVVAPLAVIGLWLAAFTWQLSRKLALPEYHLYVPESAHHEPSIHPTT